MYYETLAKELLDIRSKLLQVPANQKLSQMLRGELFVLNYLNECKGPVHPKELSEKLSVSTARIAKLLGHMEEKGLIRRSEDGDDRRQTIVTLTPEGRQAVDRARLEVIVGLAGMLEGIGPDDAREYIRIQEKIYANYLKKRSTCEMPRPSEEDHEEKQGRDPVHHPSGTLRESLS